MRLNLRSDNRHRIDLALDHPAYTISGALGIVVGIRNDHLVAMVGSSEFKALHQFREKRIYDVGNDQTQHSTLSRHQCPRLRARIIPKLTNDAPNLLSGSRLDQVATVDGARYRRSGDRCAVSDFLYIHFLLSIYLDCYVTPSSVLRPKRMPVNHEKCSS